MKSNKKSRYKLAEMSAKHSKIYAGCACIGLFHRLKGEIIDKFKVKAAEVIGGKALLDAVTKFQFPESEPEHTIHLKSVLLK